MTQVSILPKGTNFTRIALAQAVARGDPLNAAGYAAGQWGEASVAARVLKAAVAPGTALEGTWGSELTEYQNAAAEFFELVRAVSALGRLSGLRRMPLNTRIVDQTAGVATYWVPESAPIPVTSMSLTQTHGMRPHKLATLAVITNELAKVSNPAAEGVVRADMVKAIAAGLDEAFFDPANAGVTDEKPAAITYGAPTTAATANPRADLAALFGGFGGDLALAYIVASPHVLAGLSSADRPNIGARGGDIAGVPAIPCAAIGNDLALIDPASIAFADGDLTVDASGQATVAMDSDPGDPAPVLTSLFQESLTGIRTIKRINWTRIRPGVSILSGADAYAS